MKRLRTPEDVLDGFRARGETVTAWAYEHGFPRQSVYAVLQGRSTCIRGTAHRIAVALGIKADPSDWHRLVEESQSNPDEPCVESRPSDVRSCRTLDNSEGDAMT